MRKPALLIIILFISVVVLSIIRTYVSNNIATSGVVLSNTEEKIAVLQTENAVLAEKVYSAASLTNIASKASSLGFVDSKTSFVLNSGLPVAYKQ